MPKRQDSSVKQDETLYHSPGNISKAYDSLVYNLSKGNGNSQYSKHKKCSTFRLTISTHDIVAWATGSLFIPPALCVVK